MHFTGIKCCYFETRDDNNYNDYRLVRNQIKYAHGMNLVSYPDPTRVWVRDQQQPVHYCVTWSDNPYNRYAIAARKSLPGTSAIESTVGHLPREISRFTCFPMQHGATVVKVLDVHHHSSPLVQVGLEIPIQVIAKMNYCPQNKDTLFKYESLVEQHYKEPVDGKFEDITDSVLKDFESDADEETGDEAVDCEQAAEIHDDEAEDIEQAASIVQEVWLDVQVNIIHEDY